MNQGELLKSTNYKEMDGETLMLAAAFKIMNWEYWAGNWIVKDNGKTDFVLGEGVKFDPLTNANHLELVRDKAIEMGLIHECRYDNPTKSISFHTVNVFKMCKKDWPETQLKALLEATRKLLDPNKN